MIANAKLYKRILTQDTQEERWDIEPIGAFVQLASNGKKIATTINGLASRTFSCVYRTYEDIFEPMQIEIGDKIEYRGVKRIVTYIEEQPNESGTFRKTYLIGVE